MDKTTSPEPQIVCTLAMAMACLAVLYGAWPAWKAPGSGGDWGFGNLLNFLALPYGVLGVALCYLDDAMYRIPLALTSLAWAVLSLLRSALVNAVGDAGSVYPYGTQGNVLFLAGCLLVGLALYLHDRRGTALPGVVRGLTRLLLALWFSLPWVIVAYIGVR
ncbi:hypothetical protein GCM10025794_08490 [Massilia kyonggiensis]|nr:hypothetical protein [Massilia kyonggiensis]